MYWKIDMNKGRWVCGVRVLIQGRASYAKHADRRRSEGRARYQRLFITEEGRAELRRIKLRNTTGVRSRQIKRIEEQT